jgi:hypothetical protein
MESIKDLEEAVRDLPADEYREFRRWFLETDWAQWDAEIEADEAAGKLDALKADAHDANANGRLDDL